MKNFLLSICMLMVAHFATAQSGSDTIPYTVAARPYGHDHPFYRMIGTHDTIVPQWHYQVPADKSVNLDYTGRIDPKHRASYTFMLPAEPDTFTIYQTVDGDTVLIYRQPSAKSWMRPIMVYGDGSRSDFITPAVLTIAQVKATVAFPKSDPIYESCMRLIDLYYTMALQKGMSEPEAAHVALMKFGELMLTFNK